MLLVDDEAVRVPPGTAGRARRFPQMRVAGLQVRMLMLDHVGIARGPQQGGQRQSDDDEPRQHGECHGQPGLEAEPAGERIGQQPAGVG